LTSLNPLADAVLYDIHHWTQLFGIYTIIIDTGSRMRFPNCSTRWAAFPLICLWSNSILRDETLVKRRTVHMCVAGIGWGLCEKPLTKKYSWVLGELFIYLAFTHCIQHADSSTGFKARKTCRGYSNSWTAITRTQHLHENLALESIHLYLTRFILIPTWIFLLIILFRGLDGRICWKDNPWINGTKKKISGNIVETTNWRHTRRTVLCPLVN